jgi:hypothetical protein
VHVEGKLDFEGAQLLHRLFIEDSYPFWGTLSGRGPSSHPQSGRLLPAGSLGPTRPH